MNKSSTVWLIIICLVFVFWYYFSTSNKSNQKSNMFKKNNIIVSWYIWWEKKHFFEDQKVKDILSNKYWIEVIFDVKWSLSMLENSTDKDFIFPSNKTVWELLKTKNAHILKKETIFYSPLVAYSWKDIVWVLEKQKLITTYWTGTNITKNLDLWWFLNLILQNKNWENIWWDKNYWNVKVFSTNPVESNSWNMFAVLIFKILWGDLEKVKTIFNTMWLTTWSSWTIFKDFLQMQSWMYQMIIVYLNPTIFADHELITFTENWNKLIEALQNKEILDIAWEKYWFRNILSSTKQTEIMNINKEQIKNVIPMSSIDDVEKIIKYLK